MFIPAWAVKVTRVEDNMAIQRDGRLVMQTTCARTIGTPFTGVDAQGPTDASIIFIGPPQLK